MSASSGSAASGRPAPAPLTAEELQREAEWKADLEGAFEEGVEIAFSRWEALNIAINNMGGPDVNEKVEQFITTAVDWFLDEKDAIYWDDVEGWLTEVLSEEFHIDAQDGSPEQMGRLLCTLYNDLFKRSDFSGLHRMVRTQSDVAKKMMEARRVGNAESERHNRLMELEQEADSDFDEESGEEDGHDEGDAAAVAVAGVSLSGDAAASSSSSAAAAAPEPVEEKTAEQLQDEADGWETVPKKGGGKKGGKK